MLEVTAVLQKVQTDHGLFPSPLRAALSSRPDEAFSWSKKPQAASPSCVIG